MKRPRESITMDRGLTRERSSPIKILLIEDNPGDARLVQEMLAKAKGASFKLEWAGRISTGLKLLSEKDFDIILLDLSLPDGFGLDILEKVQAQFPGIPIVLLTGTFDEESIAVMALQGGAQDYLFKGNTDSNLLIRSIKYAIERKRVEEALRSAYNGLELRVQERTEELEKANQALQTEIVERKRVEEEVKRLNLDLKRRLDEMQALLDVVPVGIAVAQDPECELITVNPAAADMLGIGLDENASKSRPDESSLPFKLLRDGREIPPEELPMQYAAAHNISIREMELDIVHDDGRVVNSYEYASPLYDEQGNVRGCLGVFVDITERKRAKQELKESLLQLSKKNKYETIISIVTRSVHQSLKLQVVLENAIEAMSGNMDLVEDVCIYLVEGEEAVLKAYRNLPDWYV
ncbi:MAG TPA: response regulator, partial [Thermodesulfobacteriota bacterium]|nr:response regulator [Thermodesulfobacteriota bacterium]